MSNQWGQQPAPEQQQWGQQSVPNQQQWGQQPVPNQQQWGQQPAPEQQQWGQQPVPNQQQWGQHLQNNGWQQQSSYLRSFQPSQPPQKNKRNRLWIILGVVVGIIVLCGVVGSLAAKFSIIPTESVAQTEAGYKANTTSTTVTSLDKDGTADQGTDVNFTCVILNFVKNSTGATSGANVSDPDSTTYSVIQIAFPAGTNITQLNQGDTLEVWGSDQGVFSGTNAFGATVQEVGISAQYITDQTTNYQAGS